MIGRICELLRYVLVASLCGCAATPRTPAAPGPSGERASGIAALTGSCAGTSLVVVPEKGTYQFGLDPVETQRFSLLSRAFRAALARTHPEISGARYKVVRQGTSAILGVVVAAATEDKALQTCEAWASVALSHDDPSAMGSDATKSWLADERKNLQRQRDEADSRLQAFRKANDLMVIDLADRRSLIRSRLIDLIKARDKAPEGRKRQAIGTAIDAARTEALTLNRLEIDYARLKRKAESAMKMLDILRQREAALALDRRLHRRVRLLDPCAPTDCV